MWLIITLTSKTDAANINLKKLEYASINRPPVNVTRSHDGDIIIIKGKFPASIKRKHSIESKNLLWLLWLLIH